MNLFLNQWKRWRAKTLSEIVACVAVAQDFGNEDSYRLLQKCTSFPFGSKKIWLYQLDQVSKKLGGDLQKVLFDEHWDMGEDQ